ncbi:MAG: (d)CMP kinase [Nannocystis sp.]|uniref:(d)CMP kinase n=1 Tax=Nannocystis sp. TaxID=1962667 RepID=UPI002429CB84|nr:(d)CMP kinase [Nannocystis sp.]MBK9755368.1 (d)CMP kinase [Nannocystis sp.]
MAGGLLIVIDGPAGAGKSTVARRLAERYGLPVLDTGAIYRALALFARERGVAWSDASGLARLTTELASDANAASDPRGAAGAKGAAGGDGGAGAKRGPGRKYHRGGGDAGDPLRAGARAWRGAAGPARRS